jgi:DNA-binding ferritin-like protein
VPISKKTRESLDENAINVLGTLARMMSLQDLVTEEQFEKVFKKLDEIHRDVKEEIDRMKERVDKLEKVA